MARLSLSVLGPFQAALHSEPLDAFESNKARALLAYLVVESDRAHTRSTLAALFWPDRPERAARTNLRSVLSKLRQAIGDRDAPSPLLAMSRDRVQFDATGDCRVDLLTFRSLVEDEESVAPTLKSLEQASALYRGPFLEGFSLRGSAAFDDWCLLTRERLHRQVEEALQRLAGMYEGRGELARACEVMRRAVELEPWQEEAHRDLMRLLALDGQRSAALAQYASCRRTLMADLGVEPAEETRALYERIRDGLEHPVALSGPRHNLPLPLDLLIGREQELTDIRELLRDPGCRLITVLGPGGIGKSRLALQAAADQLDLYEHGVFLVELAPVVSPELLASTIMESLDIPLQGGTHPDRQLLNVLRERNVLLVLDNFEHMIARGGLISQVLAGARGVKLLVTSRERLSVKGEWLFLLEGLQFPLQEVIGQGTGSVKGEIDALAEYDAVKLFLERAHQVRSRLSLATVDAPSVVRICQLVEGMPLAIELAAPWVRMMPCHEIAEAIERDTGFLSSSMRGLSARHRSMRAVFDHSWRLLSDEDRRVLSRLSVFRGGFRGGAAKVVAGASLVELSDLVDSSWLRGTPAGRFEMHELVRRYGLEKLAAEGGLEEARDQHCEYYTRFLDEREPRLKARGQEQAQAEILAELGNIRAAWGWATERGDVDSLGRAVNGLCTVSQRRGWYREMVEALGAAVARLREAAEATPPAQDSESRHELVIVLAELLAWQGFHLFRFGSVERSFTLIEESMAVAQTVAPSLRQQRASMQIKTWLGTLLSWRATDRRKSDRLLLEAMNEATRLGDDWHRAFCAWGLGQRAFRSGEYSDAERHLKLAIAVGEGLGDLWWRAWCLGILGQVAWARGQYQEAERCAIESKELAQSLGDRTRVCVSLIRLGEAAMAQGDPCLARRHFHNSLDMAHEMSDPYFEVCCLAGLAEVSSAAGEHLEAVRLLESAVALGDKVDPSGQLQALVGLGHATLTVGDELRAEECFRDALLLAASTGMRPRALSALLGMADLLQEDEAERAVELLNLVLCHPAALNVTRDRARGLLEQLEAALPPTVFLAAVERGQARSLEDTVAELLESR